MNEEAIEDTHIDPASFDAASSDASRVTRPVSTRSVPPAPSVGFGDQYVLHDKMGAGGMGAVYQARDVPLHRTVAVKVMHDNVAAHPIMVRRFYKEAQITAQLEHPAIVPTYNIEIGEGGQPRLAMRKINGDDLEGLLGKQAERIRAGKPALSLFERLDIFLAICGAVQFAHDHGVIHRDLKPENVMVSKSLDAYVMDWGLAALREDQKEEGDDEQVAELVNVDDDPRSTRVGQVMGTVVYMPPEQALGDQERMGPAADQYSLGMILQQMLTYELPRKPKTVTEGLSQAVLGFRLVLPESVPSGLRAIVQRACANEIEDRYPSVNALADDVRRFVRGDELAALPDTRVQKVWRRVSPHKSAALALVFALVTLVVGLSYTQVRSQLQHELRREAHAHEIAIELERAARVAAELDSGARWFEMKVALLAGALEQDLSKDALADGPSLVALRLKTTFDSMAPDSMAPDSMAPDSGHGAFAPKRVFASSSEGQAQVYPPPNSDEGELTFNVDAPFKRPRWSTAYASPGGGTQPLFTCSETVHDAQGALLGVAGVEFSLQRLTEHLQSTALSGAEGSWLIDDAGRIVTAALSVTIGGEPRQDFRGSEVLAHINRHPTAGQMLEGNTRYVYARVPSASWTYVVSFDLDGSALR